MSVLSASALGVSLWMLLAGCNGARPPESATPVVPTTTAADSASRTPGAMKEAPGAQTVDADTSRIATSVDARFPHVTKDELVARGDVVRGNAPVQVDFRPFCRRGGADFRAWDEPTGEFLELDGYGSRKPQTPEPMAWIIEKGAARDFGATVAWFKKARPKGFLGMSQYHRDDAAPPKQRAFQLTMVFEPEFRDWATIQDGLPPSKLLSITLRPACRTRAVRDALLGALTTALAREPVALRSIPEIRHGYESRAALSLGKGEEALQARLEAEFGDAVLIEVPSDPPRGKAQ